MESEKIEKEENEEDVVELKVGPRRVMMRRSEDEGGEFFESWFLGVGKFV